MLYCITANYVAAAAAAMRDKADENRKDAVDTLITAAGGDLVSMYGTLSHGPGAMLIVDTGDEDNDGVTIASIIETVTASGAVRDLRVRQLLAITEVQESRQKAKALSQHYTAPGR